MSGKVRLEDSGGGVRVMRLADPARRNAIDRAMRDDMSAATTAVARDPSARVLVLRADGPAFCSGADLVETFGDASEKPIETVRDELGRIYDVILGVRELAIPTIAAVRGAAIGAGMNIALACDVRIAAPDAQFGALFSRIGLHPGGGCSFFLTQALGPQRALRVLLDGETIDARAALEGRLVDQIVDDPETVALEMASRWAKLDPELSRAIKQSIRLAATSGLEASMEFESWAQAASAQKPRIRELVAERRARSAAAPQKGVTS
jgi:enoyl-CoA hydratase